MSQTTSHRPPYRLRPPPLLSHTLRHVWHRTAHSEQPLTALQTPSELGPLPAHPSSTHVHNIEGLELFLILHGFREIHDTRYLVIYYGNHYFLGVCWALQCIFLRITLANSNASARAPLAHLCYSFTYTMRCVSTSRITICTCPKDLAPPSPSSPI
jgi:hypothetical protein